MFGIIILGFSYFRLRPIYFQTVAYTYDQGRDMLKAAEIVLYKNPTFIGPTTGIMGLFHGAWWYYYLSFVFLLTGGAPIYFYVGSFIVHTVTFVAMFWFLHKYFSTYTALVISLLVAVSPYFISAHIFIGNNILVLPFLALFLGVHFVLLETMPKQKRNQKFLFLLAGLSLGLVAEFEFAFGLLLIPLYVILIAITNLKQIMMKQKNILYVLGGLLIVFFPRILFEVKNNFSQTRTLLSFITHPKLYDPKPYSELLVDRAFMLMNFYRSLFPNLFTLVIVTLFLVFTALFLVKTKKAVYKDFFMFVIYLIFGLFVMSVLYRDNFWANYYEGFPYFYLALIAVCLVNLPKKITRVVSIFFLVVLFFVLGQKIYGSFGQAPVFDGLVKQQTVVDYVVKQSPQELACVRVYTPPVIPYTYDYLFQFNERKGTGLRTTKDWVDDACWFIIESDSFFERQQNWIKENVPQQGTRINQKIIGDISIELWKASQ
ncbi:hypothetical protein KC726_04985 [Candidatus Woesebacteria bacterium]|nr:hypothetical protein [Candidatus Woesebacteria bacterium]